MRKRVDSTPTRVCCTALWHHSSERCVRASHVFEEAHVSFHPSHLTGGWELAGDQKGGRKTKNSLRFLFNFNKSKLCNSKFLSSLSSGVSALLTSLVFTVNSTKWQVVFTKNKLPVFFSFNFQMLCKSLWTCSGTYCFVRKPIWCVMCIMYCEDVF